MVVVIAHSSVSADARDDERDVLVQAEQVRQALDHLGHAAELVPVTMDLAAWRDTLRRLRPQIVFNLVESLDGSDRLAALATAVIEQSGVPLTGSGSDALWLSNHKVMAKQYMMLAKLPTPPWHDLTCSGNGNRSADLSDVGRRSAESGRQRPDLDRYIIKPVFEHASLGMDETAIVTAVDDDELSELIRRRSEQIGRPCFAELFIEGREFNVSLLAGEEGCDVLPLAEIDFSGFPQGKLRIVDYRAKWDSASFEFHHTPRRFLDAGGDLTLATELAQLAQRCWEEFQVGGYARVDFRVDSSGRPWILEINTNPCLSPDAGYRAALQQAGIRFDTAIERILENGLRSGNSPSRSPKRLAAQSSLTSDGTHVTRRDSVGGPTDRRLQTADLEWRFSVGQLDPSRVRELVAATGYFYPDEVAVAEELVSERLLNGESSGYDFIFAERDGQLLGYACYGPIACTQGSFDLYWIAVHPQFQRAGAGKLILRKAEEQIRQVDGHRVYIETSNRAQYESTRAFYERCGYRRDATLADFYGPGDDKVIYVKAVDETIEASELLTYRKRGGT